MKTLIATICLLATLAPVAAAEPVYCGYTAEADAYVCANVDATDTENRDATVQQGAVGGANYYAYTFGFFGTTYRGEGAFVYTAGEAGFNSVTVDRFCGDFGGNGDCDFESTTASVGTAAAGSAGAAVSSFGDARDVCVWVDAAQAYKCQTLQ